MSDAVVAGIVGAAVGGVLTGVFSLLQLCAARREREQTRHEQNLIAAFQYFDGKTQRRSVGLSIIEAYRSEMPKLVSMFIPLLANQAVYLLTQSEQPEDAEHEYRNLDRIMDLLGEAKSSGKFHERYGDLEKILDGKEQGKYARGLTLTDAQVAECRGRVARTSPHVGSA
jgi:hypothetical protein